MSNSNQSSNQDNRDTRPLTQDRDFEVAPSRRQSLVNTRAPKAIRFITSDLDEVYSVDVQPIMVVGRRNSMKDMEVVVDLSDYHGYEMGVSRFHAMIVALNNRVTIKDLNSLNGTRINGLKLEQSREYLLEHGDKVSFGDLTFMVAFVQ